MYKEYDVVISTENLSKKVTKGCKGAILMIFEGSSNKYEVESVNANGETLDVMTVSETEIDRA